MNILFAHHLEAHHFPILVCLFAAGCYVGWQCMSAWLTRGQTNSPGNIRQDGP